MSQNSAAAARKELLLRASRPLDPQPTDVEPVLPRLGGVRAVLFDVYGTLLISASGDISIAAKSARGDAALGALRDAGFDAGDVSGDAVIHSLHTAIANEHSRLRPTTPHPEVDIVEIWRQVTGELLGDCAKGDHELLATAYECRVNPVWPMPGAVECLTALRDVGVTLGIVSNAQFYTREAMECLLEGTLDDLGFDLSLCVWSYAHRQAKPGTLLYERIAGLLHERQVTPAEVLYVGNDMLNDVFPAAAVGFRTALFAGDARSLRLREDREEVRPLRPDMVITDLRQVPAGLALAGG